MNNGGSVFYGATAMHMILDIAEDELAERIKREVQAYSPA